MPPKNALSSSDCLTCGDNSCRAVLDPIAVLSFGGCCPCCAVLCFLDRRRRYTIPTTRVPTITAIPMPMPALAPVLRPGDGNAEAVEGCRVAIDDCEVVDENTALAVDAIEGEEVYADVGTAE